VPVPFGVLVDDIRSCPPFDPPQAAAALGYHAPTVNDVGVSRWMLRGDRDELCLRAPAAPACGAGG